MCNGGSSVLMTWWLWRGCPTRSHLELGRETPQLRWYFVLRRGRVGRCQVFKADRRHNFQKVTIKNLFIVSYQRRTSLTAGAPLVYQETLLTRGGAVRPAETKSER